MMSDGWMIFLIALTFVTGVNCGLIGAMLFNFFSREA